MLRTPGASNGAFCPAPSVGAAETLMLVGPSAATAAPVPAAATAVAQPTTAMRCRCLIMPPPCRGARAVPGPPRWPVVTPRGSDGDGAGGEPALELVGRQRPGDVVPLRDGHAVLGDAVERLGVLDALGHGAEPEPAAEVDHALHDRGVRRVGQQVADERAVDLELVDRQVLEQPERGVAGPEVVDGHADPGRDEALDDAQRALGVA